MDLSGLVVSRHVLQTVGLRLDPCLSFLGYLKKLVDSSNIHTPPEACSNLKVNFQSKILYIPNVHTCRVLFIAKLKKFIEGFSEKSQKTVHNNVKN